MPVITVSAPLPEGTRPEIVAEMSAVLRKRVAAAGLCRPTAVSMAIVKLHDSVGAARRVPETGEGDHTNDPWFPIEETGIKAVQAARRACKGCPVRAECGVLAYREELTTGDVHGVRGGMSAGERRDALRRFRTTGRGAL